MPSRECTCCRVNTTLCCKRCQTAFYCNKACQINDWPQHSMVCKRKYHVSEQSQLYPHLSIEQTIQLHNVQAQHANDRKRIENSMGYFPTPYSEYQRCLSLDACPSCSQSHSLSALLDFRVFANIKPIMYRNCPTELEHVLWHTLDAGVMRETLMILNTIDIADDTVNDNENTVLQACMNLAHFHRRLIDEERINLFYELVRRGFHACLFRQKNTGSFGGEYIIHFWNLVDPTGSIPRIFDIVKDMYLEAISLVMKTSVLVDMICSYITGSWGDFEYPFPHPQVKLLRVQEIINKRVNPYADSWDMKWNSF